MATGANKTHHVPSTQWEMKLSTEVDGQRLATYQSAECRFVVLAVGGLYFVGQPDEHNNVLLPHYILVMNQLEDTLCLAEDLGAIPLSLSELSKELAKRARAREGDQ